jgi:hypothetical protein
MSARDRAFKVWQEIDQKRDPVEWIELALNEQDKITRHAIAEALSSEAKDLEEIDDHRSSFLSEYQAHSIAMYTFCIITGLHGDPNDQET